MTTTAFTSLIQQLANGNIDVVLQRLITENQTVLTTSQRETVIVQSAKWQQLRQAELQGLQSAEQLQIGRNQVIAALTVICQSLQQPTTSKRTPAEIIHAYRHQFKCPLFTFAPHLPEKKLARMLKYMASFEVIIPREEVLCMVVDMALGAVSGFLFTSEGIHVDRNGEHSRAGFVTYEDIGAVKTGRWLFFFHQLYINGEAFQVLDENIGKSDRELFMKMIRELAGAK